MGNIILSDPSLASSLSKRCVVNFLNMNTVWWIKNSEEYRALINHGGNTFFCDSRVLSMLSGAEQYRGTDFTIDFLKSSMAKKGKHLFLGAVDDDLNNILNKFPNHNKKDFYCYNPPYIKDIFFEGKEVAKIASLIRRFKIKFVWVCVGSPKQEILANQLFKKSSAKQFFNIGAAKDFLSGKKKEAPVFFRKAGLEWFYRLVTDFKTTKTKAWRSFLALFYFKNYIKS